MSKAETRSGIFDREQGGKKLREQEGVVRGGLGEAGWFQFCGEVHVNITFFSEENEESLEDSEQEQRSDRTLLGI